MNVVFALIAKSPFITNLLAGIIDIGFIGLYHSVWVNHFYEEVYCRCFCVYISVFVCIYISINYIV